MSKWPTTPLRGHIAEVSIRKGETPAEILSVTNTDGFVRSLDVFDKQVFSQDASNYKLLRFNELAYNPSRINVGSVARCEFPQGGAVSPMYVVVRCRKTLLPQFLLYFLKSSMGLQHISHRCVGAVRFMLRFGDLEQIELPLPPLPEQERIVRILDEAQAMRRLRRQADERCGTLIASLYSRVFLQSKQRQLWRVESIGDLAEQRDGAIRTGPFGSQLLHSEFTETGIPVLGIENVVTNEFRWAAPRCIPDAKYRRFERFRVFPGDVLVTIMGTVGRSCVASDDLPLCMSTKHLCVITPDANKIHPRFLWAALLFDPGVRQQTGAVGGGAIMEGWNSTIIRQLKIFIPPIAIQHAFAAGVADIRQLEAEQARSRQRLDDLSQSLLHQAFQGEL